MSEIHGSNHLELKKHGLRDRIGALKCASMRLRLVPAIVLTALTCMGLAMPSVAHSGLKDRIDIPTLPVAITAGADRNIKRWDAMGRLESTLGSHEDKVISLIRTDKTLFSGSADGLIKTWDATTGKPGVSGKCNSDGSALTCLAASSDGSLIASGGSDGSIRLFDDRIRLIFEVKKAHGGAIRGLLLNSDTSRLVSASGDQMIRTWQVKRVGAHVTGIDFRSNIAAHDQGVSMISLSSDDQTIASVSEDGSLKTWKLKDGGQILRVKLAGSGLCVAFSPDGKLLATGDKEGKIKLWNAENGASVPFAAAHDQAVFCLAWSADGKTLLSGGEDKTLRYWEISSGRERAKIAAHDGAVLALLAQ